MISQPKIDYINRLIDESLSEGEDTIELKGKFIGDEGVEALVQSSKLGDIEDLDLSNNNVTWRGAVKLFGCDKFNNLKRLYLHDNNISNNSLPIEIEAPKKAKGTDPIRYGISSLKLRLPDLIQFIEFPETTMILQNKAIIGKI